MASSRAIFLGLLLGLLFATPAHAVVHSPPQQILGFYESDAEVGPDQMSLAPVAGSTTNSETYVIRQIGPVTLESGDCLDISSREQLRNQNDANGWWTVGGIQSEHWYLWVSAHVSVRVVVGSPPTNPLSGTVLVPETGQAWDSLQQRLQWETNEVACAPFRLPNAYIFTTARFATSSSYRQSNAQYVTNDQIGSLEAIHTGVR